MCYQRKTECTNKHCFEQKEKSQRSLKYVFIGASHGLMFSQESDTRLRINDVRREDSGVYTCTATNGYGTDTLRLRLYVVGESWNV